MRRTTNLVFCVSVLLLVAGGCARRSSQERDRVLAIVREKEIKESDFREELDRLDPSLRSKYRRDRMGLLDKMVEEEVLYQHALDSDLPQAPEAKRRLVRVEEDAAIERLKERDIYSRVTVTRQEIEERYWKEATRPETSSLVKSVFYICTFPDEQRGDLLSAIQRGVKEGRSFSDIATQNSLACQAFEFDSAAFNDLPQQIRTVAVRLNRRTGVNPPGTPLYFFKDAELLDAELLSPCARRIRRAVRDEKRERALAEWLSSRRASSTIQAHEKALEDLTPTDALAAEVNGLPVTVGDVAALLEGLSIEQRRGKEADKGRLLDEAVDRELWKQEALKSNLNDDPAVKEKAAREKRRVLVDLVVERNVSGVTEAAREKSRADLVAALEKAAGVKIFAEDVKKMYIPPSRDIQKIFGGGAI